MNTPATQRPGAKHPLQLLRLEIVFPDHGMSKQEAKRRIKLEIDNQPIATA